MTQLLLAYGALVVVVGSALLALFQSVAGEG